METLERVKGDLQRLKSDLAELAAETNDRFHVSAEHASERMRETAAAVKQSVTEKGKRADQFAHENPWVVAGVAAVVGMLLSSLLSRRSEK